MVIWLGMTAPCTCQLYRLNNATEQNDIAGEIRTVQKAEGVILHFTASPVMYFAESEIENIKTCRMLKLEIRYGFPSDDMIQ